MLHRAITASLPISGALTGWSVESTTFWEAEALALSLWSIARGTWALAAMPAI